MPDSPEFDELYQSSRQRLVLQAFALTGDLSAAESGVRDAFVAARHHWMKVERLADREEWVRSRAWASAQRRHAARPWRRKRRMSEDQRVVLIALQQLKESQRKAFLLHHLAEQPLEQIGREIAQTQGRAAQLLHEANEQFTQDTAIPGAQIREALDRLEPLVGKVSLPPTATINREGRRRRTLFTLAGSLSVVVVLLGAGLFVSTGHVEPVGAKQDLHPVKQAMLLTEQQVAALTPGQAWTITSTDDNTEGTGLNSVCQTDRFADARGLGTFVRKFAAVGAPARSLVQTVEISDSPGAAEHAYKTTQGWFAGCKVARLRLLNAWQAPGLGEQAELMSFQLPDNGQRLFMVGMARTGSLTVSLVQETLNGKPTDPQAAIGVLSQALSGLCASDAAGGKCATTPQLTGSKPPPSGETPGTLSAVDLPPVGKIQFPWLGSDVLSGEPNVASTPCDSTSFTASGAADAKTRSYLIPQAPLPPRFGITETFGSLANSAAAHQLVNGVIGKMQGCEKANLGAKVSQQKIQVDPSQQSEYALWRVESQINDQQETATWWMGITRVGNRVAQVSFAPVGANDLALPAFTALVERARDRLFEVTPQDMLVAPAPPQQQQPNKPKKKRPQQQQP